MKKLILLFIALILVNMVIAQEIKIQSIGNKWQLIDSTGAYNTYIADETDKKTHVGWYLKYFKYCGVDDDCGDKILYDCNGNIIKDDKDKNIILKYETNKVPNPLESDGYSDGYYLRLTDARAINIDECITINPTVKYTNLSMVVYKYNNLEVNTTLKKWNGFEYVTAPEDIWIDDSTNNKFKFGANDTISKENTRYQYVWKSNYNIQYDGKYYVSQKLITQDKFNKIFSRDYIDTTDICVDESNCSFYLENNTLLLNFTGFYNIELDMIIIDPYYITDNVTSVRSITNNVRSEDAYSHLSIRDKNILFHMPFDVWSGGQTYDYTDNDIDGKVFGVTFNSSVDGISGGFVFNGTAYVNTGASRPALRFNNSHSITGWINPSKVNITNNGVLGKAASSGQIRVMVAGGDKISYFLTNSSQGHRTLSSTAGTITLGEWNHFACLYNGSTMMIWINGVKDPNELVLGDMKPNDATAMWIGHGDDSFDTQYSYPYNGTIGQITIWNYTLTQSQIIGLYNRSYEFYERIGNQTTPHINITITNENKANITIRGNETGNSTLSGNLYTAKPNSGSGFINNHPNIRLYLHLNNESEFGENDSRIHDFSGKGHTGTMYGSGNITQKYGIYGGSFELENDTSRIELNNSPAIIQLLDEVTVGAWVKPSVANTGTDGDEIVAQSGVMELFWGTNERYYFRVYNATGSSKTAMAEIVNADTDWHFVVGTYNGSVVQVYVDGENEDLTPIPMFGKIRNIATVMMIGMRTLADLDETWFGHIDEVFILNISLTKEEIQSLYTTGSLNYMNDGFGINWTYSGSGDYTELNNSHINLVNLNISNTSTHFLTDFNYTGGYYTPIIEDIKIEPYFSTVTAPVGDTCDCSSIQAGTTIDCTEECDIDTCNAQNQTIVMSGSGQIDIIGTVSNYYKWVTQLGCRWKSTGGGGFS